VKGEDTSPQKTPACRCENRLDEIISSPTQKTTIGKKNILSAQKKLIFAASKTPENLLQFFSVFSFRKR
jgi:hypothetical protein